MIPATLRFLPALMAALLLLPLPSRAAEPPQPSWEQAGVASWYGAWHEGRRTSSGEIFHASGMTAAHASLPLGTKVRVTRQDTGNSVVVTVNDRQPPKRLRVIDLSRAAASRLGLVERGTGMVTLEPADSYDEVAEAPDTAAAVPFSPPQHGPRHTHPAHP